jgi:hypothetical protein
MGHFERGKWIPGVLDDPSDKLERLREALVKFGEAVKETHKQFDAVFDKYGHFEKGKWVRDNPLNFERNRK